MTYKDLEKRRRTRRAWARKNKDKIKEYRKREYLKRASYYKEKSRKRYASLTKQEKKRLWATANTRQKEVQRWHRKLCLDYYSNGTFKCACCNEGHYEFLVIDHINGGGSKHRKEIKKKYPSTYTFLVAQKFPLGYRVLCYNCNCSLGFYGYCPHKGVVNG